MKRFEILSDGEGLRVHAEGSTRPALFIAALEGMFAATVPEPVSEEPERVERPFKLEAKDVRPLLADFLNEALATSEANHETYDDVSFALVTDTKAVGSFLGRKIAGSKTQITSASVQELAPVKNAEGNWEAIVAFRSSSPSPDTQDTNTGDMSA
jgi:SHS2 domain-containing protein